MNTSSNQRFGTCASLVVGSTILNLRPGNDRLMRHAPCVLLSICDKWLGTMITMGGDLQPGCLADRLLTGLGQPQISP